MVLDVTGWRGIFNISRIREIVFEHLFIFLMDPYWGRDLRVGTVYLSISEGLLKEPINIPFLKVPVFTFSPL